jgi:uncharacterized membrane-anchored protein YitT (DUF2179 family)
MNDKLLSTARRLILVLTGAMLMAFNIVTFVRASGLIPSGFNGIVILIQKICLQYGGFHIPFSIMLFILNAIPAAICFKYVGKKFTIYSIIMVIVCGLFTDWLPLILPAGLFDYFSLKDPMLSAVFGGVINAFAISLCLYADATSGGTDLIAIFISERYRKDSWGYIFAGNCVVLSIAGIFFNLEMVLDSVIFQFATTMALTFLYRNYQQRTLLIITSKPDEVYAVIKKIANHAATSFDGVGKYESKHRVLLYSVVVSSMVKKLIPAIREVDSDVFINVLKTEMINGKFYIPPKD